MARSSAGMSSLARAVRVLETFDTGVKDLSATEIAERAQMPISTTHRLLSELVTLGRLERGDERRYRIGLRLWELAVRTPGALGIRAIALPVMRSAHAKLGQHLQLAVLSGADVLHFERLSAPNATVNFTVVGGRMPFHATSSGLVLAAFADTEAREALITAPHLKYFGAPTPAATQLRETLLQVRSDGYAVTRGYIDPAATSIAVPITVPLGGGVAAVAAIVPTADTREAQVLSIIHAAAGAISRALRDRYRGDMGVQV